MALEFNDYLLIVNSIMDAVELKEQQKAQDLISKKIDELNAITFICAAEKQKSYVLIISRLKMAEKKILYKAERVEKVFKDTWVLLAMKINEKIEIVKKEKANHARYHI